MLHLFHRLWNRFRRSNMSHHLCMQLKHLEIKYCEENVQLGVQEQFTFILQMLCKVNTIHGIFFVHATVCGWKEKGVKFLPKALPNWCIYGKTILTLEWQLISAIANHSYFNWEITILLFYSSHWREIFLCISVKYSRSEIFTLNLGVQNDVFLFVCFCFVFNNSEEIQRLIENEICVIIFCLDYKFNLQVHEIIKICLIQYCGISNICFLTVINFAKHNH